MKENSLAVIVGRFQFPFFNESQIEILSKIISGHRETLFMVGLSYCTASKEDPLDLLSRKDLIWKAFPGAFLSNRINIGYIQDEYSNKKWSYKLDNIIESSIKKTGCDEVAIYGSYENFILRYTGGHSCREMDIISVVSEKSALKEVSSSIRNRDFRNGAFHVALNQFNNPMPCVDMAVIDKGRHRILLGRKEGQDEYRFFGGFAENFGSYEDDAIRELTEETGLPKESFGKPRYLSSNIVSDWRYIYTERKVKTMLFLVPFLGGMPKASDDICEVLWAQINDVTDGTIKLVGSHDKMFAENVLEFLK